MQQMMACDPALLGYGRDVREAGPYDKLEVVGVWRITNKAREAAYQETLRRIGQTPVPPAELVQLPEHLSKAIGELGISLDSRAGEAVLLHGTKPENLHTILFDGLNPAMAAAGLFGRGTYFAESAGKIDQYATADAKLQDKTGPLADLHDKLYAQTHSRHPGNVFYALVCRVALGRPAVTTDAQTRLDDHRPLFADPHARNALAALADGTVPHSLRAETGGVVQRFREFVVFSPDQILVEYLVAYRRERTLCLCGLPARERMVGVEGNPDRGRKARFCHWPKGDPRNCSSQKKFYWLLPRCPCGLAARVRRSKAKQMNYYTCGRTRGPWCDWFGGWAEPEVQESPDLGRKRKRYEWFSFGDDY